MKSLRDRYRIQIDRLNTLGDVKQNRVKLQTASCSQATKAIFGKL